jgi:outer membrane biosynthesis protein TonB
VVQDPPKPQYFKVYNFAGEQVGAYSTQENAQKKLDTIEAGSIKNPAGVTIVTKVKQAPVVEPPFIGDVIVTPQPPETPVTPTEPPVVVDTPPTPEETPTEEPKPATSHNILDVLKAIWELIITPIIATIKFFKKGGK